MWIFSLNWPLGKAPNSVAKPCTSAGSLVKFPQVQPPWKRHWKLLADPYSQENSQSWGARRHNWLSQESMQTWAWHLQIVYILDILESNLWFRRKSQDPDPSMTLKMHKRCKSVDAFILEARVAPMYKKMWNLSLKRMRRISVNIWWAQFGFTVNSCCTNSTVVK